MNEIKGINFPITIQYYLSGGKWYGRCPKCIQWVQWLQDCNLPIKLGWRYWHTGNEVRLTEASSE